MPELVIDDSGFANVTIGQKRLAVDLYAARNLLMALYARVEDEHSAEHDAAKQHAYLTGVCDLLAGWGFGAVSHLAAMEFEEAIFKAVDELKKTPSIEQTPALPTSTEQEF